MNYTEEQRADDAKIVLAMGWRNVVIPVSHGITEEWMGIPPDDFIIYGAPNSVHIKCGLGEYRKVPYFHADEKARRTLLEWIRVQGKSTVRRFLSELHGPLTDGLCFIDKPLTEYMIFDVMLATPAQVAAAALRVIKEAAE